MFRGKIGLFENYHSRFQKRRTASTDFLRIFFENILQTPNTCAMRYELTQHARQALEERSISLEWMERTIDAPELTLPDPEDSSVERRFLRIPEFGGRVLRVAVNTEVEPPRVVSVFFDRAMKGKL